MPANERFSIRNGYEQLNPFQIDSLSEPLRISLYNNVYQFIYEQDELYTKDDIRELTKLIWTKYFHKPLDEHDTDRLDTKVQIKHLFTKGKWFDVYNFIEQLLELIYIYDTAYDYKDLMKEVNETLVIHNAGYTLYKGTFISIVNQEEIQEIKSLEKISNKHKLQEIKIQLETALQHLSAKPIPDYRNSIKESISMVETATRLISKENTLGKTLVELKQRKLIDPQLAEGFEKLYAFTNGPQGIRHALMDNPSLELPIARFFLISCSAFTNYLIQVGTQAGLIKEK